MTPTEPGFVKTTITSNGLATITFGHRASNSLPSNLLIALREHIQSTGDDPAVRLILIQSDGNRTFCAGASFDELLTITNEASGRAFFSGFAEVINAIRKSPKLVIGRVQGKAVGGGVGLIAACDYCFATMQAAIKLSEVSLGIGPFVIAPAIERKAGLSALTKLALNPTRFFDAQWAAQHGLFQTVESTVTELDKAIEEFCSQLLIDENQAAHTALKRTLWHGTDHWDELLQEQAALSGKLILSPAFKQRLAALKH